MRLGELLVRDRRLTAHDVEVALRAQVIYGGRLGTNLVELGQLDLDGLTLALAAQTGVPAAVQKHFEQVDPQVLRLLSPELAERHQAIPLGLARLAGPQLVVAFMDPHKPAALEEIGAAAEARVTPCVAPELRVLYYLERFYGVRRKNRFLRVAQPEPGERGRRGYLAERRRYPGDEPPPPLHAELPARPAISVAAALERIQAATSRDEIGDAIVDHLRSAYGCGLVLVDREGIALGWKGFAPGVDPSTLEAVAVPLSAPSAFREAHERRGLYRGVPPADGGARVQERVWKLLRVPTPAEVVVAPVVLAGRVVCLIYAHALGGAALPDQVTHDLAALAAAAATAFAGLIQAAKRGGFV